MTDAELTQWWQQLNKKKGDSKMIVCMVSGRLKEKAKWHLKMPRVTTITTATDDRDRRIEIAPA